MAAEDDAPEPEPPPEIRVAPTHALERGSVLEETRATDGQSWRVYARRFDESPGPAYVVAAVADAAVIGRHEARRIETFAALGGLALLPLAAGGYYLVKMSSAPATERLQRFTADAAHELRTPVTVLRATAEVALQRPRSPDEYVSALKDVAREADHLGLIIEAPGSRWCSRPPSVPRRRDEFDVSIVDLTNSTSL